MGIRLVLQLLVTFLIALTVVYVRRLRAQRDDWGWRHGIVKSMYNGAMLSIEEWKQAYNSLSADALRHQAELKMLVDFAVNELKTDELEIVTRGGVAKFYLDKVTLMRSALKGHVDTTLQLRDDLDKVRLRRDKWKREAGSLTIELDLLKLQVAAEKEQRALCAEEVQELDTVGSEAALMAGDSRIPALDYPRGEVMLAASSGPHGDEAQTR